MAQPSTHHLKHRGGRWHLKLTIPRAVRHLYLSSNGKPRTHVEESLGTADIHEANRLKHRRIAHWLDDFRAKERRAAGTLPPDIADAKTWREALREARDEDEREATEEQAAERAHQIAESAGVDQATRFYKLATAKTTLRDAWEKWSARNEHNAATKLKDEQAFRGLLEFLGVADAPPAQVTPARAREYVQWLNTEAQSARGGLLSKATKEARIAPLRIFWTDYLEHNELVPRASNPWRAHKITGARKSADEQPDKKRPYTDDEIMALLEGPELSKSETVRYSKRDLLELYALAFYTGARIGEIGNRLLGDVEKIKGGYTLHIRTGKTDESPRSIPILHPIPVAVLTRLIGKRTDKRAQLFEEFIPGGPNGSLAWYPSKALGRYRDKVGLGTATDTHSTRRRFITDLLGKGEPLTLVQFYVGHKPPGVTAGIYAKASAQGLRTIAEAVRYPTKIERAFKAAVVD